MHRTLAAECETLESFAVVVMPSCRIAVPYIFATILSALLLTQYAFGNCPELESTIAQKLHAKGVQSFTLQTLSRNAQTTGKTVGTCEGGTKKIVYFRQSQATADSEQRYKLWLLMQAKAQNLADLPPLSGIDPSNPSVAIIISALKSMDNLGMPQLLQQLHWEDWQAHIIWSWGDTGALESEVQRAIISIDADAGKDMNGACILPAYYAVLKGKVGRQCIMQVYACDAAKSKFDTLAWKMTMATQMHNPGAVNSLTQAGAFNVAEFIRNNRGCR